MRADGQAGYSVIELLVLTAPLCVLSIILSSKLAATSSAHTQAEWQASLAAQTSAQTYPSCGTVALPGAPWIVASAGTDPAVGGAPSPGSGAGFTGVSLGSQFGPADVAMQYAGVFPADIRTSYELLDSQAVTGTATAAVAPYAFQSQAEALIPGPSSVTSSATYVCNEPYDGDAIREQKRTQLVGFATYEATHIYKVR